MSSLTPAYRFIVLVSTWSVALAASACSSTNASGPVPASLEAGTEETSAPSSDDRDAAVTCEPQSVKGFVPTFHAAAAAYRGKCTSAQIDDMIGDCIQTPNNAKCASAKAAAAACAECVFGTVDSDPATPIVEHPGFFARNLPACVGLLTGDSSPKGCAFSLARLTECDLAACPISVCPRAGLDDLDLLVGCSKAAERSMDHCKSANEGAQACARTLANDVTDVCFEKTDGDAIYEVMRHYSQLFCGTAAPLDGGS